MAQDAGDKYAGLVVPDDELIPSTSFRPIASPARLHGTGLPNADALRANPMLGTEDIMRLFIASKVPVTLWGPVGAGKTKTIQAFAREEDEDGTKYRVATIQPSTEDPTSLHGLMFNHYDATTGETKMRRSIPQVADDVWVAYANYRQLTIMFLDEMTTCMPAQQNALLGLLTDGKYGEKDISPYVTFVMAANPPGTVSTCLPLSEAVINRGGHIAWYGDVGPFLDNWASGFGMDSKRPNDDTVWAVRELAKLSEGVLFRDENFDPETGEVGEQRWLPQALCPYDQMQPSPRALTEFAKMYETINGSFAESPDSVRHYYIEETMRAMMGPKMADRIADVNKSELERLVPKKVYDKIRIAGVENSWSTDKLRHELGDSLFKIGNRYMTVQNAVDMMNLIYKDIVVVTDDEELVDTNALKAGWAMASTAPNEEVKKAMLGTVRNIVEKANRAFRNGKIKANDAAPKFIPDNLKSEIMEIFRAS